MSVMFTLSKLVRMSSFLGIGLQSLYIAQYSSYNVQNRLSKCARNKPLAHLNIPTLLMFDMV